MEEQNIKCGDDRYNERHKLILYGQKENTDQDRIGERITQVQEHYDQS
jgi:hypothetical protein